MGLAALLVLALLSGCATSGAGGGQVQPTPGSGYVPNSISVSGFGEASGTPDVAFVTLGVNVQNADIGRAVSQANERMNAIMDAMREAGIAEDDLKTVGFNVYPQDQDDPQTGLPTGERIFHVDQQLNVKVRDLAATGTVIQAGLDAGANTVTGLSFNIDDMDALEAQARTGAVENARAKAQQIADALGVALGGPLYVTEGGGYIPPVPYPPIMDGAGRGEAGAAPPVSPGQLTVSVSVTVIFALGE